MKNTQVLKFLCDMYFNNIQILMLKSKSVFGTRFFHQGIMEFCCSLLIRAFGKMETKDDIMEGRENRFSIFLHNYTAFFFKIWMKNHDATLE